MEGGNRHVTKTRHDLFGTGRFTIVYPHGCLKSLVR